MTDLDDLWPPSPTAAPRRRDQAPPEHARRHRALSRDEIVQAAVALADAEGPGAVNMRRIAKELDVGAMSLYWHVTDKDQLLDLMLDAVEGEDVPAGQSGDWRVDLVHIARQKRRLLLRHPWVVDFISERTPLGPNALLQIERSLSVLDGSGLGTRTKLQILTAIDTYVTGSVLNELREVRVEQARERAGLTDVEIAAGMQAWWDRLDQSGMFVRFLRIFDEGIDPDAAETRDDRFEFGLDCLLDGIAARLPQALA
ncbi:MAG: TetR/AcrR family transcriptional regulator [Acidimicrobiales bacterium]|jgi:AcrR family transcriptional regulator